MSHELSSVGEMSQQRARFRRIDAAVPTEYGGSTKPTKPAPVSSNELPDECSLGSMADILGVPYWESPRHHDVSRDFVEKTPVSFARQHAILVILAMGMTLSSGCDPVRTVQHNMVVTVTDDKGLPAPNVKVRMKESWESWQSWEPGGFAEDQKAFYRQRWESEFVPWYQGVTNAQGKAVLQITQGALDNTTGNTPPANRDIVSNREYLVKLDGQSGQDEMRVMTTPDTVASGKRYSIRIDKIEAPVYVP